MLHVKCSLFDCCIKCSSIIRGTQVKVNVWEGTEKERVNQETTVGKGILPFALMFGYHKGHPVAETLHFSDRGLATWLW